VAALFCSALLIPGCGGSDGSTPSASDAPSTPTTPGLAWTEEDLTFVVGPNQLHGILTMPSSRPPHPAVVMPFNSPGPGGELPTGVSSRYQTELAHSLAEMGYAAFRYDPPGIGESTGEAIFQSLQARADETTAALHRVQDHPMIQANQVGLWGISQEAWVISVAAADHPDDVAFIIPVSGAGISVAEQQVWGVEAQSRAAGLEPDDVARATLIMRLLVDWQLTEPAFHDINQQAVDNLGNGPWNDLFALVYPSDPVSPSDGLTGVIEILTAIQDEPWAAALHIERVYLPGLLSIPLDQIEATQIAAEQSLLLDPRDHLTRVTSPVLAFFGENDIVQPTDRSAELFAEYLDTAGNDDVTIVLLPDVGHDILLSTPGYWDQMVQWLERRA
jgi:pimeloyl-ACP methyl ester carboxylesterase